jgi:adenylate cyclase class 2
METEYEAKYLEVDVNKIKDKLNSVNAIFKGDKFMRRYVYDLIPKQENSWIRLRDNGKKITLTIKEIKNDNIDGTKELEIEVDDFEKTNQLLEKLGFKNRGYQENKRSSYEIDSVCIEIDTWPMIPTYLEIEGKSEQEVLDMIDKLELDKNNITSIGVKKIYEKYGIDLDKIDKLLF